MVVVQGRDGNVSSWWPRPGPPRPQIKPTCLCSNGNVVSTGDLCRNMMLHAIPRQATDRNRVSMTPAVTTANASPCELSELSPSLPTRKLTKPSNRECWCLALPPMTIIRRVIASNLEARTGEVGQRVRRRIPIFKASTACLGFNGGRVERLIGTEQNTTRIRELDGTMRCECEEVEVPRRHQPSPRLRGREGRCGRRQRQR